MHNFLPQISILYQRNVGYQWTCEECYQIWQVVGRNEKEFEKNEKWRQMNTTPSYQPPTRCKGTHTYPNVFAVKHTRESQYRTIMHNNNNKNYFFFSNKIENMHVEIQQ